MIRRTLRHGLFYLLLVTSAATPLLIYARNQRKLQQNDQALRRQAVKLSALQADNARLKSFRATNHHHRLSNDEISELLHLRGEAGILRQQTNLLQTLREKNAQTSVEADAARNGDSKSEAELAEALSADTIASAKNILAELQSVLRRYAAEHEGQIPQNFNELREYFPKQDGHRMTGLYTFEFVRDGGPKPGDWLLLREISPRYKAEKRLRVYGFSDGTASEQTFADNEQNEIAWERQQLGLPPPVFQQSQ